MLFREAGLVLVKSGHPKALNLWLAPMHLECSQPLLIGVDGDEAVSICRLVQQGQV